MRVGVAGRVVKRRVEGGWKSMEKPERIMKESPQVLQYATVAATVC